MVLRPRRRWHHVRLGPEDARDWARVARLLAGKAVGVCFGGGGARGNVHFGVIQAGFPWISLKNDGFQWIFHEISLVFIDFADVFMIFLHFFYGVEAMQELGIPIDVVSGTSFGALAAAMYAISAPEPSSLSRVVKRVMTTQSPGGHEAYSIYLSIYLFIPKHVFICYHILIRNLICVHLSIHLSQTIILIICNQPNTCVHVHL